ncbi:DNA-binding protein [Mucilaginibacter sp. L196]|uniref:DNA-binding protein n=1 Tax=Mucilaginibacter sp. L196 TaxID=1641870 RepID=UPI00131C4479|nr:DNA-binding protein [Mucilaginibacter sp. L196]
MKRILILASLALFLAFNASAQKMIDVKDAAKHVGETLTVCGKVFSTKLITPSNMTFLDLGGFHPDQLLTVVIKGEDRSKFTGQPEVDFKGKSVCVTGTIIDYKGKPEIVLSDPKDIKLDTK